MERSRTEVVSRSTISASPATMFGDFDSESLRLVSQRELSADLLMQRLHIDAEVAEYALKGASDKHLFVERPNALEQFRRLRANSYREGEAPLHIVDVKSDGPILSGRPFQLVVDYQNFHDSRVAMASVTVTWAGDPYVIQQAEPADRRGDALTIHFDEKHSLPVGQAQFAVTLYREDGAASSFRRNVYVLPSNPLSLALAPAGARVTGSWSARGDYEPASDTFLTQVEITLANGDGAPVAMNRRVDWEFWDGPVGGGTRIESGNFQWGGAITVPSHGVWRGVCWFSSPRGSGIFNTYDRKEDMAISISMRALDGRVVRGEITARVLLSYGVNIIKVGDFGSFEHSDLYAAVDRMRQIYEQRDITLNSVRRYIIDNSLAGSYTVINSENEVRDMWEDWSVRNDSIDVYVVQDFNWSTFNGYAGDIPGPASKGGRSDGVALEKTGFIDGSGNARLNVETLAQLIGHEVGHYLGLAHKETTNNLMRSNTGQRGPLLDYDQYRTMFPHGFMHYE
jgi:hypothetical protein